MNDYVDAPAHYWEQVYDVHKSLQRNARKFKQNYDIPVADSGSPNPAKRAVDLPEISSENMLLKRNKRAPEMFMGSANDAVPNETHCLSPKAEALESDGAALRHCPHPVENNRADAKLFLRTLDNNSPENGHPAAVFYKSQPFHTVRDCLVEELFQIYSRFIFSQPRRNRFDFAWENFPTSTKSNREFLTSSEGKTSRITFNARTICDCQTLKRVMLKEMARATEWVFNYRERYGDFKTKADEELGLIIPEKLSE